MLQPITSQYVGFGFQLSSLVYTNTVDLCILKTDLRKIPHAMDPNKRNYCVYRRVFVGDRSVTWDNRFLLSQITGIFTFTADRTSVLQRIKDQAA